MDERNHDYFTFEFPDKARGTYVMYDFIDEMKAAGLAPAGENGTYFQPVELTAMEVLSDSSMSISSRSQP